MALDEQGILPQSQILRAYTNSPATSDIAVQIAVDNALNTALSNGVYTATVSMTGYTALNIQNVMNKLKQLGFTGTLSGTTLTLSW